MVRPSTTNEIPVVVTNVFETVVVRTNWIITTNAAGAAALVPVVASTTNSEMVVSTNMVQVVMPPVVWWSNYVAAPVRVGAEAVGAAGGVLGAPWLDAALSLALAGLSTWLAYRNRKNRERAEAEATGRELAESKLQTAIAVGETLVDNLEEYRRAMLKHPQWAQYDAALLRAIQTIQTARGVKSQIASMVDERTDFTHQP